MQDIFHVYTFILNILVFILIHTHNLIRIYFKCLCDFAQQPDGHKERRREEGRQQAQVHRQLRAHHQRRRSQGKGACKNTNIYDQQCSIEIEKKKQKTYIKLENKSNDDLERRQSLVAFQKENVFFQKGEATQRV